MNSIIKFEMCNGFLSDKFQAYNKHRLSMKGIKI